MNQLSYTLGRRHAPDRRDSAHPLRAALTPLPPTVPLPSYRYWPTGPTLSQGQVPACVGYAWKQWLATSPVRHAADRLSALDIYHEAQKRDEWEGEDYSGSSVRAGAKYMKEQGRLAEYVWAASTDEVARWLLTSGPVVLGTDWYADMFSPTEGQVHIGGDLVGGHAYLAIGFNSKLQAFRCINSWGRGWGENGRFWLGTSDLAYLLGHNGEACAGVELRAPA